MKKIRLNAIRLEEKEKRERELLSQIIEEAEDYKVDFYSKRKVSCEAGKAANKEKEKVRMEVFLDASTSFRCLGCFSKTIFYFICDKNHAYLVSFHYTKNTWCGYLRKNGNMRGNQNKLVDLIRICQ